jgi:hypothetical protein
MIAEQLIRSGQAFMQGTESPATLLNMVSDSTDEKVKNYWQHVIIVEVDQNEGRVEVHPVRSWGSWYKPEGGKKQTFVPDRRATLVPVFFPSGGNQLNAQGFYGLPIYLVWDQHWQNFTANSDGVQNFLKPRLLRTAGVELSEEVQELCCRKVHELVNGHEVEAKKTQAVLILALTEKDDPFMLSPTRDETTWIANSILDPECSLCADTEMVLERVWEAKLKEGAEKGEIEHGTCAFTGKKGPVVSGDNKAWPWFTTTWEAPFPETFGGKDHVKRLALSPEAYKYLTVGANLFGKLTKQLDFNLNKQLFAPVDSARKRKTEDDKKMIDKNKATILGSAMVTPLLDVTNLDKEDEQLFAEGMEERLTGEKRGATLLLSNLLGYEGSLPEELTDNRFRLTSLYFSGDPSCGDIHLHATIEDIVPSVLKSVGEITSEVFNWSAPFYSEKQAWLHQRTGSLPYLLVTAYGPASLWQSLSAVLHSETLPWTPFVRGISHRCAELSHNLSDNSLLLRNEAVFYATFRHFYNLYHRTFNLERRTMRSWQDLVHNIGQAPVQEIDFQDTEELGFAAGYLVRRFANQYWAATDEKDYLTHRVMTFGSDLKPEVIYRRALGKLPEYAMRVKDIHLSEDFRQRLGVWLSAYPSMKSEINKQSDEFMAAFWAGYMLGRVK